MPLNESPSEKEGKCREAERTMGEVFGPSMKVPPKRKGNASWDVVSAWCSRSLNESPSENRHTSRLIRYLKGAADPSMKVPPKRKGNLFYNGGNVWFEDDPQ